MPKQIKVGDTVVTETNDVTTDALGWHRITGTRFLTGIVASIEGDVVKLDTEEGTHTTLLNQIQLL